MGTRRGSRPQPSKEPGGGGAPARVYLSGQDPPALAIATELYNTHPPRDRHDPGTAGEQY